MVLDRRLNELVEPADAGATRSIGNCKSHARGCAPGRVATIIGCKCVNELEATSLTCPVEAAAERSAVEDAAVLPAVEDRNVLDSDADAAAEIGSARSEFTTPPVRLVLVLSTG